MVDKKTVERFLDDNQLILAAFYWAFVCECGHGFIRANRTNESFSVSFVPYENLNEQDQGICDRHSPSLFCLVKVYNISVAVRPKVKPSEAIAFLGRQARDFFKDVQPSELPRKILEAL